MNKSNFNHLSLAGIPVSDEEYVKEFGLDEGLANTPAINDSLILNSEDPAMEESRIEFLYALNGLREEAQEIRDDANNTNSDVSNDGSNDSNDEG